MAPRPKRGEIYYVDFHPARGREQAGHRPALVVQNDVGNQMADYTVVAAVTTTPIAKPYPFMVALAAGEGGLRAASVVNCSQILTIDQGRLERRLGRLGSDRMREVDEALRYQLALA